MLAQYLRGASSWRPSGKTLRGMLARTRAGDPELAEDALLEAYYAVARLENPERIADPRAHYCGVLLRSIHKLRSQRGAALIDDFEVVAPVSAVV